MNVGGATVLVTGASSGIGAALAVMLADRGATVGLVARREDRLRSVLERCQVSSPRSRMWVADLAEVDRALAILDESWEAFDGLDVLVNNAAIPKRRDVRTLSPAELDEVMRVNFTTPARLSLAVLPRMLERDRGVIVNVSSAGGRMGIPHEAAYCASKFALCGWSEAMAMDLAGTGVRVRLIIPGAIATEIWDRPGNEPSFYQGPFEPPETVAAGIIDAIDSDRFEHYLPGDMKAVVEFKTTDIDTYLAGAAAAATEAPAATEATPGGTDQP
jgi:short-subunit dehydrogenase